MADKLRKMTTFPVRNLAVCLDDVGAIWDQEEISTYNVLVKGAWITFGPSEYKIVKDFIESLED